MNAMDLQTRKLNLIEYLINLRDESLFSLIESVIIESKNKKVANTELKPFTQKQIVDRADISNQDYLSGKIKSQEHLEKESENW